MFNIDGLVIAGHQKIIEHYRRLRDSAQAEQEREQFQKRMDKEADLLHLYLATRPGAGAGREAA